MRSIARLAGGTLTVLAAVGILGIGPALAAQQTTLTKFSGTTSGSGTWSRTITDISEPNGPGGGTIQTVYVVNVVWTNGMTAAQVATAYKNACNATLPSPATGANGYGAVDHNVVGPTIRLSKQAGTYNFSDGAYPTGITVTTYTPGNAEDAPLASPAGLVALAAGLSALGLWARRRRMPA